MVAIKEIIIIISNCKVKWSNDCESIISFNRRKLKISTPKISDKLLSYVINSLLNGDKFRTLGIAMALLIIQNGIALVRLSLNPKPPKYSNANANPKAMPAIVNIAPKKDFRISFSFDLFSSSSRDPSRTIKISPIVPKTGRIVENSGV